jgi:hypothetical protein
VSFGNFYSMIRNERLRAIADHWNEARGQALMPGWTDINPKAIAGHLSIVWSWRKDPISGALIGRLAGESIIEALGGNLRGQTDTDFFASRGGDALVQRQRRVVEEPCFYHGSGFVFCHARRIGSGERIIMPLADDHKNADGSFGATVYGVGGQSFSRGTQEIVPIAETATFIALD